MATNLCNSDLIGLHYWFVSVLWFIMEMGMKSVKPLTLLSGKVCSLNFDKNILSNYMNEKGQRGCAPNPKSIPGSSTYKTNVNM